MAVLWIAQVVRYQLHVGEGISNPTQTMRVEFHGYAYMHGSSKVIPIWRSSYNDVH